MNCLDLTKTIKTMNEAEKNINKILVKHHTIDVSEDIELIKFSVEYVDNEVLEVEIKFYLSLDNQRHNVKFLISRKNKKLDYSFISGYIAKYIEDLEI
jgi:competence transcription factor ComK